MSSWQFYCAVGAPAHASTVVGISTISGIPFVAGLPSADDVVASSCCCCWCPCWVFLSSIILLTFLSDPAAVYIHDVPIVPATAVISDVDSVPSCYCWGVVGVQGLRQINICHKVPLQVNFYTVDNDILHCLLRVLSFYALTPRRSWL
jgi:hypothetical protein